MATKNFVPRATGQGQIGTTSKKWDKHIAISGAYSYVSSSGTGSFNHLLVGGNSVLSGDLTLGGDITIGDAASDNLVITADLSSSLIPNASDAYNLGSATQRWNNLFLSGSISASGGPHHFEGNVGLGNYAPTTTLSVTGVISGSSQLIILGNITGSGNLEVAGNISGSATSTGSFGRIETAGNINTVGRIYESGTSVIDHATAMAIVFGG